MHAVIMAGGRGARLAASLCDIPKPLAPIGGRPIIDILLTQLRRHGVSSVTIALGYRGDQIRDAVGTGERFGLCIDYVWEETPLGTCGALGGVLDRVGERFILANGDLLTDLDLTAMIARHDATGSDATVGVFALTRETPYGVLSVGARDRITHYAEKPLQTLDVSMGVYVLRRDAVAPYLTPGVPKDTPALITELIVNDARVTAFRGASVWIDIGTPADYARAVEMFADAADDDALLPQGEKERNAVKNQRALVTGAGGFVGRAVVRRLESLGLGVARLAVEPSLGVDDLARRIVAAQPDYVLHLAAPPPSDPPEAHARVTHDFALTLLEAGAVAAPAARIVTLGSAAEFGALTREDRPLREDDPCAPTSAYGQAKHAVTQAVMRLNDQGRDVSALRLFTAAGAGAPPHTVLGAAARQLHALPQAGGEIVLGPLDAWRDYLLVDEAARLIVGLVMHPGRLPGLIHVASGQALSIAEIIAAMIEVAGKDCRVVQADGPPREAGPLRVTGDVARLRGLGFEPEAPGVGEVARAVMGVG